EGCPRYVGRLFRDVTSGPSPVWLKARLLAAGMRPISNIVDVTNYAMLALGNPLHAFDFAKLSGGRIVVRPARAGEQLKTLVELAGARWTGETDVHQRLPARPVVAFRPEKTDAVMGVETPPDEQHAILRRLGFEVDGERVVVPTWRARDVTREVDLIEEVARFRLDDVPFRLPRRRAMFDRLTTLQRIRRQI